MSRFSGMEFEGEMPVTQIRLFWRAKIIIFMEKACKYIHVRPESQPQQGRKWHCVSLMRGKSLPRIASREERNLGLNRSNHELRNEILKKSYLKSLKLVFHWPKYIFFFKTLSDYIISPLSSEIGLVLLSKYTRNENVKIASTSFRFSLIIPGFRQACVMCNNPHVCY